MPIDRGQLGQWLTEARHEMRHGGEDDPALLTIVQLCEWGLMKLEENAELRAAARDATWDF